MSLPSASKIHIPSPVMPPAKLPNTDKSSKNLLPTFYSSTFQADSKFSTGSAFRKPDVLATAKIRVLDQLSISLPPTPLEIPVRVKNRPITPYDYSPNGRHGHIALALLPLHHPNLLPSSMLRSRHES